jgi:hypothetical protein
MKKKTAQRTTIMNKHHQGPGDKSSDEDDKEAPRPPRPRLARELRALGITSTEGGSANESEGKSTDASNEGNEPPREIYSSVTSFIQR